MTPAPHEPPDLPPPHSQRGPLLVAILLVLVVVGLLGAAVLLGIRYLPSAGGADDQGGAESTTRNSTPRTPAAAPTRSPAGEQAGLVRFQLVAEERPRTAGSPCPTGTAWTDFEEQCLRLGGGFFADVTAEVIVQDGESVIELVVHPPADRTLATFTEKHQGARIAVVAGEQVVTAPTIVDPIYGGRVHIQGAFSRTEADRVAAMIRGS